MSRFALILRALGASAFVGAGFAQAPPNNSCGNALPLALGANSGTLVGASVSTNAVFASCPNFGSTLDDVWFTYVSAVACDTAFAVPSGFRVAVYSGDCGSWGLLSCPLFGAPATIPMTAGQSVIVRVGEGAAGDAPFTLTVTCVAPPANDDCAGAIPLGEGVNPAAPDGQSGATFSNVGALPSSGFAAPAGCAGFSSPGGDDVFFSYASAFAGPVAFDTAAPSGFAAGTLATTMIEIYAACAPGVPLACASGGPGGSPLARVVVDLSPGVVYYVRVSADALTGGAEGTFYLTVRPAADDCATAPELTAGTLTGTFVGATPSPSWPGECALFVGAPDLWFVYTPTVLTLAELSPFVGIERYSVEPLYGSDCSNVAMLDCDGGPIDGSAWNGGPRVAMLPNVTYLFRIGVASALNAGPFNVGVSLEPIPSNDLCANPIDVVDGSNPAAVGAEYSTIGGRQEAPYAGDLYADVWFRYTPTLTGPARVTTSPGAAGPPAFGAHFIEVRQACDPATSTSYGVSAGGPATAAFHATAGTPYLIRVGVGYPGPDVDFRLDVTGPFVLLMESPFGVGSLSIRHVNGSPFAPYWTILTTHQGAYPYGYFFGIDPSFSGILLQVLSGTTPFVGFLAADGTSLYDIPAGAPPITLFAVSLEFAASGAVSRVSPPATHAVP